MVGSLIWRKVDPNKMGRGKGYYYHRGNGYYSKYSERIDALRKKGPMHFRKKSDPKKKTQKHRSFKLNPVVSKHKRRPAVHRRFKKSAKPRRRKQW